ncbi:MAG TPA: tetratricopeptide repeat protein, partial [Casimicrobiaceae bacterium]|nr:tetratricopeptide repeat protein [Casimicrobiaceae bacterium]
ERVYRSVLAHAPNHPDTLVSLGALNLRAGRRADAIALFSRVIGARPNDLAVYLTIGQVLHVHDAIDDAARLYAHALELFPTSDEICYRLGHIARTRKDLQAAATWFRRAIDRRPGFVEAHFNLGSVLQESGRSADAVQELEKAIRLDPTRAETHYDLGISLAGVGRFVDAFDAYRKAIALNPDFAEAHNNLGAVAKALGRLDDSAAAFRAALRIRPEFAEALSNLAGVYEWQARHDDALVVHARAIELAPESAAARGNRLFTLLFHPDYDAAMLRDAHDEWNRRHAQPLHIHIAPHANDRSPDRRLRIGYLCGLFRDHVVGRNLIPLLREHDRSGFDIICYSNNRHEDAITERFREMATGWREIGAMQDDAVAQRIRSDAIDVLVDANLHMDGNRLLVFARKPAPVQVTFAGYPGSTGLETIDYRLTDVYLDAPGTSDASYIERSWRLPETFWCYDPMGIDIEVGPLPATTRGHVTFGCFNNFSKINEPILRLWARVLGAVPRSRLLLLAQEGEHRRRALDVLNAQGVERDRIEFASYLPREQYLALFRQIDISLDTVPYNGHTTSLDSLWMGVPVVTMVGNTVVGRAGVSQLTNLRLPELIARSADEYVAVASALAQDIDRLTGLRGMLRQRMQSSPLMDAPRFARSIETAYREMWRRWCAGGGTSARG